MQRRSKIRLPRDVVDDINNYRSVQHTTTNIGQICTYRISKGQDIMDGNQNNTKKSPPVLLPLTSYTNSRINLPVNKQERLQ